MELTLETKTPSQDAGNKSRQKIEIVLSDGQKRNFSFWF